MTTALRGCECSSLFQACGMVLFSFAGKICLTQLSHCHIQAQWVGKSVLPKLHETHVHSVFLLPWLMIIRNTPFWKEVSSCYSVASLRVVINSKLWLSFNEITGLQNTFWGGFGWLVDFPNFWRVSNDRGRKCKCVAVMAVWLHTPLEPACVL